MSEAAQVFAMRKLLAQVQALRGNADAASRPDPVRLHYIQALAQRLQAAPPAVQTVLQAKLEAALKALGDVAEATVPVAHAVSAEGSGSPVRPELVERSGPTPALRKARSKVPPEAAPSAPTLSLLGELNQHIHAASNQGGVGTPQGTGASAAPKDLKSAVRFRETWARISAETEVDQAAIRAPENAGPLNAHNLVLRTLALMRELSPDYLRRFMSHTESLLWLDQAYGQLKQPAGKARGAKATKSAKSPKA